MLQLRCKWPQSTTVLVFLIGFLYFQDTKAQGFWRNNDQELDVSESRDVENSSFNNSEAGEKVKLDVYYETNCPDSMDFITKQLWPTYEKMSDIMKINLIPFGKATEKLRGDGSRIFYCHHGPSECFGNTVQTCAIKLYPDTKTHLSFINCMESYFRPSRAGSMCARRSSVDYSEILDCVNGPDGNEYMHEMAVATRSLNPRLNFVPWIVVNDVFSDAVQRQALDDLPGVVCMFYKGQSSACQS